MDKGNECEKLQQNVNDAITLVRSCFNAYPLTPGSNNHDNQSKCVESALSKKEIAMNALKHNNCSERNDGGRTRKSNRKQSRKSNRKQSRKSNRKHKKRAKNL